MTTKDQKAIFPIACIALLCSSAVLASPEGGEVVEGDATIEYDGDWTRVLTGEITIIDWLNFNIAQGETVEFIMPSEASRVLNRITSGVPTEIMGNLIGNGQVFIVNPSGVIFGQDAVVNVGALYAAAGNISNADFLSGTYRFTDARGIVENRGHLQGDLIALVGGRVANHGTISASNGTVILAAGEQVLIGELLGHTFVRLERPTDLENTPPLSEESTPSLAAGDVYSLAAWNTGTIDGKNTTVAVSAGHMAIDAGITAGELSLIADGESHIELGADLHANGPGLVITGDVILTDDVSVTSDGSVIAFKGTVDSEPGTDRDLFVDSNGGSVRFTEHIGSVGRLGTLEVHAGTTRFFADVAINNELNLYTAVSISGVSTTFDVGMGTALFGDVVYSAIHGRSDIAFVYDGQAWVGQGEARAPFQFRAGIGTNGSDTRAFRNITFGADLSGPSRSSAFVFATGANQGFGLIDPSSDLGYLFEINATESITMGQGQKITSLGSLALNAEGDGFTSIAVGDLNVLGDLRIASLGRAGGQVLFNTRAPGRD
jgi:filamentous hemagglutinin family protein